MVGKGSGMAPWSSVGWGDAAETERAAAPMLLFLWVEEMVGRWALSLRPVSPLILLSSLFASQ